MSLSPTTNPLAPDCTLCGTRWLEPIARTDREMISARWRCATCGCYFEAVRADFKESHPPVRQVVD
jgi:hypothetical protein